ncbi:MAG: hypothetical protein RIE86_09345 [Imperialibacter sp.]|uniref:hypothetical protein n=1 Tax=Imperialibacter sp. TaxID=2038411 RepID=UPI0032EDBCD2
MPKYLVTSTEFEGSMVLEFDAEGILRSFQNETIMRPDQVNWLATHFPLTKEKLDFIKSRSQTISVKTAVYDLTFENFWSLYNYKFGNKIRAAKLWKALSEADKIQALEAIAPYNYYLQTHPNQDRLYPETYLSGRRFENDFRAGIKRKM